MTDQTKNDRSQKCPSSYCCTHHAQRNRSAEEMFDIARKNNREKSCIQQIRDQYGDDDREHQQITANIAQSLTQISKVVALICSFDGWPRSRNQERNEQG